MHRLIEQFLKFGVVGAIAFVIDFGVMVALTEFLGINPVASAAVSFIVSVTFNYLASMRYVFTHREELSRSAELTIFVVLSVIGLIINEAIMWAGTEALSVNYMVTKVVATGVVMLWNFFSRKRWLDAGDGETSRQRDARATS